MQPSTQLRNAVRAAFISEGTDLAEFCRDNKICDSNANKALSGKWSGLKARKLCLRLIEASGAKVDNFVVEVDNQSCQLDLVVVNLQPIEK